MIDFDGSIVCLADLLTEASFHAGEVNEVTIGIEIYQGQDAEMYDGQLDVVVRLVDFLTRRFKIQRQLQSPYKKGPVPRIAQGGRDVVGIYGHRDVTTNRGSGDPGDAVFDKLTAAGYEAFDYAMDQDRSVWRLRQEQLNTDFGVGLTAADPTRPGPCFAILETDTTLSPLDRAMLRGCVLGKVEGK